MNSPTSLRHSPTISKATNIGGKKMARSSNECNNSSNFFKSRPLGQTDW